MKTVSISIFLCGLMVGIATAQDSAAPPSASPPSEPQTLSPAQPPAQAPAPQSSTPAQPTRIAAGSVIPVSLTKTIDAKKAKTGDEVIAKVTEDMKTKQWRSGGAQGHQGCGTRDRSAKPRSKEQKESAIGIAFDRAVMKNGSEMQMPMSIQAIIGPQNDQNSAERKPHRSSKCRNGRQSQSLTSRRDGRIHAVTHAFGSECGQQRARAIRRQERTRVPGLQRRPKAWSGSLT